MKPKFFASPNLFREWLAKHGSNSQELWVGFHKKNSGTPSITWPEAVDAALCFGWIDGVRKSLGDASYTIRFTPRKPKSTWSAVNIKRVEELTKSGLMQPSGMQAFQQREEKKSGIYSYEQRQAARLSPTHERGFRANKKAWEFFQRQPPWYRRVAAFWVVSAKKEDTRQSRLARLIEDSWRGRTIPPLTRSKSR
ncbi:MAG TPA: YdeI/OmpD-associated family protein [Terriglobales bacterium]|nr:YdeI/OmpD-associated family protein [Terriglobales bacterium]